jgi:hypothetical protein
MTDEELLALLSGEAAPAQGSALPMSDEDLLASLNGEVSVSSQPAQIEEPSALDKTRHVLSGGVTDFATGLMDAPYNMRKLAEGGIKSLTGYEPDLSMPGPLGNIPPFSLSERQFSKEPGIRDIVAVTGKEMVDPEQNPGIDALRTGVEWGAGAPLAAASKLSMIPDLLMGAGAGIGDYLQDNKDSPVGEIAGASAGFLASLLRGKVSPAVTKAEERARKFIEGNIQDPDATKKALEKYTAGGSTESGTLADVTGDRGIFNVEAGAARDPAFGSKVKDIDAARQQQIAEELRKPFGDGTPEFARDTANDAVANAVEKVDARTARLDKSAKARLLQGEDAAKVERSQNNVGLAQARAAEAQAKLDAQIAQEGAEASALPLSTNQRPAQASKQTYEALAAERAKVNAAEQSIWENFKAQPDVSIVDMRKSAAAAADNQGLTPDVTKDFHKAYRDELKQLRKWGNTKAGGDVQLWLRKVQNKLNQRFDSNKWSDADEAMKAVKAEIEEGLAASNPLFREAKAATREMKDRFDRGQSGKALATAEPEQFISRAGGLADEGGAVLARKLLQEAQTPGMEPMVIDSLKSAAYRYGKPVDQAFMNQFGDVFDALPPSVRSEFQASIDATGVADTAAANATDLGKATTRTETATANANEKIARGETRLAKAASADRGRALKADKRLTKTIANTWLAKYAKNPETAIRDLLKPGKGKDLGRLYKSMIKRGEGESFKAAIGDKVRLSLAEGSDTGTKVLPSARGDFKAIRDVLEESDVLSKTELDGIAESLAKTESVKLRGQSWADNANKLENEIDNLAASATAAVALKALPGSSLVMAGAVRRIAKKIIPKLTGGNAKEMAAMENFLTNPQAYFEAAKGAKTSEVAVRRILTEAFGASLAAQAMNEEENQ